MGKIYTALGLMSGTSGDGVDVSIICSDGADQYNEITNKYFKYDQKIYENLHKLRSKILNSGDLKKGIGNSFLSVSGVLINPGEVTETLTPYFLKSK